MTSPGIKAVMLGGGTGSSTAARGLIRYGFCTGITTTCDDGGSSALISDGMDIGPVGDLRQFLSALTEAQTEDDLAFRFADPPFHGHPLGNIVLAALIKRHGQLDGIKRFSDQYGIDSGTVIPMTAKPLSLTLKLTNGRKVTGESELGEYCDGKDYFPQDITPKLSLRPKQAAILRPEAVQAIEQADVIIVGPGKWYSSIAPLMLVKGMRKTLIRAHKAGIPIICVVNIMEHAGQTVGLTAARHVQVLEDLLGCKIFTHAIVNTKEPHTDLIAQYAKEGEAPVQVQLAQLAGHHYKFVFAPLLSGEFREQNPADLLVRTVLRHDPNMLADLIMEICLRGRREKAQMLHALGGSS